MKTLLSITTLSSALVLLSGCSSQGTCPAQEAECAKCLPEVKQACPPCAKCPGITKDGFIIVTTENLEKIIHDKSAVILDARSGKYDDGRRIPGAISLNDKSSAEQIAKVVKSKDQKIVTYCANPQCPASARLAKHLKMLGYTNIVEYPLGIQGWAAAGKTIEKGE